ncbi:MAG: hypothetical protein K0U29_07965 [Gammaproteobacteria bacterium]|nr:hypothetical protein [Gammaproteobacteria bacterium]MCH9744845.1 hypothetical protein [Gammaproteobacteria bacterium]
MARQDKLRRYDRQVLLECNDDVDQTLRDSPFKGLHTKWHRGGNDPAKFSAVMYNPRTIGGVVAAPAAAGAAAAPAGAEADAGVLLVNKFDCLRELTCNSRIYITGHSKKGSSDLGFKGSVDVAEKKIVVSPKEMADLIAAHVDREKVAPKVDAAQGQKRKLRIRCYVCWGGFGQVSMLDGEAVNDSFASQLCAYLHKQGVDAEVLATLTAVASTMGHPDQYDDYAAYEQRMSERPGGTTIENTEEDSFFDEPGNKGLEGKFFKDVGFLKVLYTYDEHKGRQCMFNAYMGRDRHSKSIDPVYDLLNQILCELEAMDIVKEFLRLINELSYQSSRNAFFAFLIAAITKKKEEYALTQPEHMALKTCGRISKCIGSTLKPLILKRFVEINGEPLPPPV